MPIILATVLIINMVLFVAKLKNDSIATNASLQIAQGLAWAVIAVCNWNDGHRASVVFFAGMSLISFKKAFKLFFKHIGSFGFLFLTPHIYLYKILYLFCRLPAIFFHFFQLTNRERDCFQSYLFRQKIRTWTDGS